ncbi:hypothetical protein ACFXTN_039449 [Malus domestica]
MMWAQVCRLVIVQDLWDSRRDGIAPVVKYGSSGGEDAGTGSATYSNGGVQMAGTRMAGGLVRDGGAVVQVGETARQDILTNRYQPNQAD